MTGNPRKRSEHLAILCGFLEMHPQRSTRLRAASGNDAVVDSTPIRT